MVLPWLRTSSRWDFMMRSMSMFQQIDYTKRNWSRSAQFIEVLSRLSLGASLIQNKDGSNRLVEMNKATGYNDDEGVEFGPEIQAAAQGLLTGGFEPPASIRECGVCA
jgi:hypothetical protein